MSDVTEILSAIEQGDPQAAEELLLLVYDELRRRAPAKMVSERSEHTLQVPRRDHFLRAPETQPQ
jgi:DNA-binding GntR family transcriptional regulator